jgi:hypothetical protein
MIRRPGIVLTANVCLWSILLKCCSAWFLVHHGCRQHRRRSSWVALCLSTSSRTSPDNNDDEFFRVFHDLGFQKDEDLQTALEKEGLWNNNDGSGSHLLQTICRDYYTSQQPDQLTRMLQDDFNLKALQAHTVRSTLWSLYSRQEIVADNKGKPGVLSHQPSETLGVQESDDVSVRTNPAIFNASNVSRPLFRDVGLLVSSNRSTYGLHSIFSGGPNNSVLQAELDEFWHEFMTRPNPYHPTANPLRNETAKVYVRHANLFLGWFLHHRVDPKENTMTSISLRNIFKDDSVESVSILLEFIRWLREERKIGASYEANVWRGLTKLLQYRHTQLEGKHAATLEGRPAFQQIRKWHTEAQNAAKKAPRRSQEDRKWLSWEEYLGVVQHCKQEFLALEQQYYHQTTSSAKKPRDDPKETTVSPQQRKVAVALQRYLILAIFATVPDRQRTIRELKLHQSFVKDTRTGIWSIKHSPEDYKTGRTYGVRPSLQLNGLTEDIDTFLEQWRPMLKPNTEYVFVQPRTHNPMTQDSVYQVVSRAW